MLSQPLSAPFSLGGTHEIDTALARRLLSAALCEGGDYADLFFEYRVGADFLYEEERIKTVGSGITLGLGVRVLSGDATGYAYCESLDEGTMVKTAKTAAQIAVSGKAVEPAQIKPYAAPSFYPVSIPSLKVLSNEKLDLLRRVDQAARKYDPRITKVQCSFSEEWKEILLCTSDGRMYRDVQPLLRIGVSVIAQEGDKRQSGSTGGGGRAGMDFFVTRTPESYGQEAARIAIAMLHAKEAPAGPKEVILSAGDSGILLHEAVGHGLEADFNRKETSNYSGRIGTQVASSLCTVIDDGTLAHSRGSINVDDEGHESKSNILIEQGILRSYMHDHLSAKHFNLSPSGNGRRQSFRHPPMPRMTNTLLAPGPHDPEEMIRSVKQGIYAKRFSGGQVNINNGDFVFSLTESYLIEDGKITAPLKGVNLIGNGPEVLTKVTMLGNDFTLSDGMWVCGKEGQSVPVGIGTPTIKISSITVGGTQV